MAQRDPYSVLGAERKASADAIKKASRKLARQYPPDRSPDDPKAEERFKEIQSAYDIVGDPDKRKQYDRGGIFFCSGGRGGGAGRGGGGRWGAGGAAGPRGRAAAATPRPPCAGARRGGPPASRTPRAAP